MSPETKEYTNPQWAKAVRGGAGPAVPTTWYVVLHMVNGIVRPQMEWWRSMKVDDLVYFLSPDGDAQVQFTPEPAQTSSGQVVDNLFPFGIDHIKIIGDVKTAYPVINSCKSLMSCSILNSEGELATWTGVKGATEARLWPQGEDLEGGTHVCTGGGDKPVVCS